MVMGDAFSIQTVAPVSQSSHLILLNVFKLLAILPS